MDHKHVKDLVLAALFLALGLVLPFLTGQIPTIGKMLSPMHIAVYLCGLVCGWQYGLLVGLICPILIICLGLHQNTVVFYMKYL